MALAITFHHKHNADVLDCCERCRTWLHCLSNIKGLTRWSAVKTAHNCWAVKGNWKYFQQFCKAVKPPVDALNWIGLLTTYSVGNQTMKKFAGISWLIRLDGLFQWLFSLGIKICLLKFQHKTKHQWREHDHAWEGAERTKQWPHVFHCLQCLMHFPETTAKKCLCDTFV